MQPRALLKREEIDEAKLTHMKELIKATCAAYIDKASDEEKRKSFFVSLFSDGNAELIAALQSLSSAIDSQVLDVSKSSHFKSYVDVLVLVHKTYKDLQMAKVKNPDVINQFQALLITYLEQIEASDWLQEKRQEQYRDYNEEAMIKSAIQSLETATLYETDEKQAYCEKWGIDCSESDHYVLWKSLVDNYKEEFDDDNGARYIVELQHKLGL